MRPGEVGEWTEAKLAILGKYLPARSKVLAGQVKRGTRFRNIYIDAFSGPGEHISRATGDRISGSPLIALSVKPSFDEYHFIDINRGKLDRLRKAVGPRADIFFYNEDCNRVLCDQVFARVKFEEYCRGFCFLDPNGLHLRWEVFKRAANTKTIEVLVNFSIMDLNMNCGLRNPEEMSPEQATRLTAFWGDETWRDAVYRQDPLQPNLFGEPRKAPNELIVEAFCERLRKVAGFAFVAAPVAMRNSVGATVYYLVFGSPNATGAKIANEIFAAYRSA